MARLGIGFWNLNGVSREDPGLPGAGNALRSLVAKEPLGIVGLTEVGSRDTFQALADLVGENWIGLMGHDVESRQNIGVLYDAARIKVAVVKDQPLFVDEDELDPVVQGREVAGVFVVTDIESERAFWLVVVHLKARDGQRQNHTRARIASDLRIYLEDKTVLTGEAVIIGGDFNAEPWEACFREKGLRTRRRADETLACLETLKLYNPTWRLLSGIPAVEDLRSRPGDPGKDLRSSPPPGTWKGSDPFHRFIDGIVLSEQWLRSLNFGVLESTLRIATDDLWYQFSDTGDHRIWPVGKTKTEAVTDHLPIVVQLEIA